MHARLVEVMLIKPNKTLNLLCKNMPIADTATNYFHR